MISGKSQESVVATLGIDEHDSGGRDSRARCDVGTLRLSGRDSPKVSRQVLAHVPSHLQHVEARNREDGLQLRIRLDGATLVERVLLNVDPDLLRHLGTRHGLAPADGRQSIAELLRGEDADALLLHGKRILLASGLLRDLASGLLRRLERRLGRLRNSRLRGLDRDLGRRRHGDRGMQVHRRLSLEPKWLRTKVTVKTTSAGSNSGSAWSKSMIDTRFT